MSASGNFAIIVLAAGQSSRLGKMKQLLPINGKSLIEVQLALALKVTKNVYCVLGYQAEQVASRIVHLPITTIINSDWAGGMASSIATGIQALTPDIEAVMIVLVDQWQLTANDLIHHRDHWQSHKDAIIVAQDKVSAELKDKIGPPVIFPHNYFTELTLLTGKQGAKPLLVKYRNALLKIPLVSAFIDVDTPEQLIAMNETLNYKS
ncbi:nucleotidyltransferase family protein [Cognaticolwellia mytili]|uniref:nucleotidyltransferase family protein n=1 Tax=Cognaticolwellia mytili TaxID=1888913 RepID=UPI000A1739F9|nr:nucleotidyltransferase family protein [Cognaticolwellia mytili]